MSHNKLFEAIAVCIVNSCDTDYPTAADFDRLIDAMSLDTLMPKHVIEQQIFARASKLAAERRTGAAQSGNEDKVGSSTQG